MSGNLITLVVCYETVGTLLGKEWTHKARTEYKITDEMMTIDDDDE